MRGRSQNRILRAGLAGVFLAAAALWGSGSAYGASSGMCVTALVQAPIVLPDGSMAPPGVLRLCEMFDFSPVASLHRTYVNGVPVGMLRSQKRASEGPITSPRVLFRSDGKGNLQLVGYVVPRGRAAVAYVLSRQEPPREPSGDAVLARR